MSKIDSTEHPSVPRSSRRSLKAGAAVTAAVVLVAAGCGSSGTKKTTSSTTPSSSSSASSSSSSKKGTLTIGVVVAESGPLDYLGGYDLAGAQAGMAYLNAHGGLDGYQLKMVVGDDQSSPGVAATVARKLIEQDHVSFLMGPEDEGTAAPVVEVADAAKEVLLEWGGNWPLHGVSVADSHSYSFPVLPSTGVVGIDTLYNNVLKPNGFKTIGLLTDSEAFSQDIFEVIGTAATTDGFKVLASQTIPTGATDVTAQVLKLLAAKPSMIFDWTVPGPNTIVTLKAIRAQNPTIPVMVDGGLDTTSFEQAVGAATLKNVYILGSVLDHESFLPANSPYRPAINTYLAGMIAQGKYKTPQLMGNSYEGWDGMIMLNEAVNAAGSVSPSAVLAALKTQKMYVPGADWARTPSNYGIAAEPTLAVQFENGAFVNANK